MDFEEMTGRNHGFDTLVHAVSTSEKIQKAHPITTLEKTSKLEYLQPFFAYKPLEVIKKTLENTTQWAKTIAQYPMRKHHISRVPWNNRKRLREEVATDTIFMGVPSKDDSLAEQVYVGLISRMINVYPMPRKASTHIIKLYQDFLREEGAPEVLHRDMSNEQKVQEIIDLNHGVHVQDS